MRWPRLDAPDRAACAVAAIVPLGLAGVAWHYVSVAAPDDAVWDRMSTADRGFAILLIAGFSMITLILLLLAVVRARGRDRA